MNMSRTKNIRRLKTYARTAMSNHIKYERIINGYIKTHPWAENRPMFWGLYGAEVARYKAQVAECRIARIVGYKPRFMTLEQVIEHYKKGSPVLTS